MGRGIGTSSNQLIAQVAVADTAGRDKRDEYSLVTAHMHPKPLSQGESVKGILSVLPFCSLLCHV